MGSMDNIVAGLNATSQQEQEAAMQTASSLWQRYGKSMPFGQWVNNEVVKVKSSGLYKDGMTFKQVVETNLKEAGIEIEAFNTPPGTNIPPASPTGGVGATANAGVTAKVGEKQPFRIGGYNGYVVVGGIVLAVGGLIYLGTKFMKSTSAEKAAA